jgi:AcrR family transcriptional regulator
MPRRCDGSANIVSVSAKRIEQIVAAARTILASEGADALTMRRLAAELGIQAPSLYKHLPGKPAVEDALIAAGLREMGAALHAVVDAGGRVIDLLRAYRDYALREPNLYRLATAGQLRRDALPAGLEEWSGSPFYRVTGDPAVAQALWSFAHGMVILELDGRYPPSSDLDATWSAGARAFQMSTVD